MSIFEYLMVMVAIVLGLSVTQLLRGLSKIARGDHAFAPVVLWAIALFYLHIQVWWGFWDFSRVDTWNQFGFTFILFISCVLFAATELLVPLSSGVETDWRAHFSSVRLWFYGALFTFAVVSMLATRIMLDVPLTHPYRITQSMVCAAAFTGLLVKNPRAHTWICLAFVSALVAGQVLFRLLPGLAAA